MFDNTFFEAEEYEPLQGSGLNKRKAGFVGGGVGLVLVLGCLALFSGGSATATDAAQTQALATATTAATEVAVTAGISADANAVYSVGQYDLIYNVFSFAIAAMGAATVFFFFQFSLVGKQYRTALVITGLVTLIAFYHYIRIFNSFTEAFTVANGVVTATGVPFNDAYRYVDWLLTVPLLLTELILVMRLDHHETRSRCLSLGGAAAVMIVLGYPGEVSGSSSTRWVCWVLAMLPFVYIVYTLFFGLRSSIDKQGEAAGLVRTACWVTVLSWCTYPIVYVFPMLGLTGAGARTAVQIGYSISDVIAKPVLGLMVWMIAAKKTAAEAPGDGY